MRDNSKKWLYVRLCGKNVRQQQKRLWYIVWEWTLLLISLLFILDSIFLNKPSYWIRWLWWWWSPSLPCYSTKVLWLQCIACDPSNYAQCKREKDSIFFGASTHPNLPNLKKTTDATIPIARVVFEGQWLFKCSCFVQQFGLEFVSKND